MVTSSFQNGEVEFVEIESPLGGECRIRNPWGAEADVVAWKNGRKWKTMEGSLLVMKTGVEDVLVLVRKGSNPDTFRGHLLSFSDR